MKSTLAKLARNAAANSLRIMGELPRKFVGDFESILGSPHHPIFEAVTGAAIVLAEVECGKGFAWGEVEGHKDWETVCAMIAAVIVKADPKRGDPRPIVTISSVRKMIGFPSCPRGGA